MAKIIPFGPKGMPPLPPVERSSLVDQIARCKNLCDEMRALITELEYITEERVKAEHESDETQDHAD